MTSVTDILNTKVLRCRLFWSRVSFSTISYVHFINLYIIRIISFQVWKVFQVFEISFSFQFLCWIWFPDKIEILLPLSHLLLCPTSPGVFHALPDPLVGAVHHEVQVQRKVNQLLNHKLLRPSEPFCVNKSLVDHPPWHQCGGDEHHHHKTSVFETEKVSSENTRRSKLEPLDLWKYLILLFKAEPLPFWEIYFKNLDVLKLKKLSWAK